MTDMRVLLSEENDSLIDENKRLRTALDAWAQACRVVLTMEGPRFMGIEKSAAARAWKATLDALEPKP